MAVEVNKLADALVDKYPEPKKPFTYLDDPYNTVVNGGITYTGDGANTTKFGSLTPDPKSGLLEDPPTHRSQSGAVSAVGRMYETDNEVTFTFNKKTVKRRIDWHKEFFKCSEEYSAG